MLAFLITGMMLPAQAAEAQMKTKTITLYSSIGFVAKEAELNTGTGNQNIRFTVPKQTDNESIVIIDDGANIKQFKTNEKIEIDSVLEKMVQANKGKQVIIITQFFKINGTIKEVYKKQYLEISEPKLLDSNIAISNRQSLLVPITSIEAMSLAEKAGIESEEQEKQKTVNVSENAFKSQRKIKALYFVNGASWNPNYQLFWDSDTKATLYYFAKATNNTDEDWNSVQLQIVAGQPNMKYVPLYYNYRSEYAMDKETMAAGSAPGVENQFVSSEEQEYHIYGTIDGITIEKNTEAMIPVLSKQVNYEKEYEWRAGDSQVKYNIRIFNDTGEPLAAGFLSAYSNNMYAGGNYIKWTAEDDNAIVYLAPALDITAKKTTDSRTDNQPSVSTTYYNIKLHLENHKSTSAKLKTTDYLPSNAENFQSNIKPDKTENNQLEWTTTLKAGEKKDITFSYETKNYKRY